MNYYCFYVLLATGFVYIQSVAPIECSAYLEYFEKTWIGKLRSTPRSDGLGARVVRRAPRYPTPEWNMHEATLNGDPRTNNVCEGVNNGFKAGFHDISSPVVWKV